MTLETVISSVNHRAKRDPMSPHRSLRLPISTRHAFALAFDLAVRRDAWNSLVVPLLLRAPWILTIAVLPSPTESERPGLTALVTAAALLGDFLMLVVIGAMLRYRARSVFNTPEGVHPAPVMECYALGLKRVPWLIVTEIVRNLSIVFASFFMVLPGIFLGFRLSFATEAVVLHEPNTSAAFRRSFHITPSRFERWFEMIVASVIVVLCSVFVSAALSLVFRTTSINVWVAVAMLLVNALNPIIQYAWTFFYLRLFEIDLPDPEVTPTVEPGPLYAAAVAPAAADAPVAAATPPAAPLPALAGEQVPAGSPNV